MNPDRDRLLEDALKHELPTMGTPPAADACLDAETIAAWADGGLDPASLAMAEAHASNCARCQALLGTVVRTTPATPAAEARGAGLWRWWFAPLAATAAAVTVWMVVPQQPVAAPPEAPAVAIAPVPQEAARTQPAPATTAPLAERRELGRNRADAPPPSDVTARKPDAPASGAIERPTEESKLADTAVAGRVAAAAPPAMAQRALAEATEAEVTARSSPSPEVIWTVGRAGTVRLATDGRTFVLVPFPETVDLTAVTAEDERRADVTTADGRVFRTADGGRTWTRP